MDHLAEDVLDRYCLERLPAAEAVAVEAHLVVCDWCLRRVQITDTMIEALRQIEGEQSP